MPIEVGGEAAGLRVVMMYSCLFSENHRFDIS